MTFTFEQVKEMKVRPGEFSLSPVQAESAAVLSL